MDGVDLVASEWSVGLLLSDDPYLESNSHNFSYDMSLWPWLECGHIFWLFH